MHLLGGHTCWGEVCRLSTMQLSWPLDRTSRSTAVMTPQYKHHQSHPLAFTCLFSASSPPGLFLTPLFSHLTRLFFSQPRLLPISFSLFLYFLHCPLFFPPILHSLSRDPSFILVPFSPVPSSLSATWGYLFGIWGWILQGLMPLWIYPTEPISAAVLCITSFTPLHISCLIQSGPLWPKHVIPLGR